ncbi:MAG: TonB-dependent receptor plug domain-containing protein [Gammaproteobacteria bacterium]|nr:TonB-dependent receptor plug domain-containing protein [Gammaproteobacteria bacterium]MYD79925.1 TonB-dependent receptor plug domain-containing protein [Gammaproteobacteria bacterium]
MRRKRTTRKGEELFSIRSRWLAMTLSVLALLLATNVSWAQEEDEDESEDDDEIPAEEIEEMVVTGTRLSQNPGEVAGQLIVIDEADIRASGEVTLERVLRQLPQNLNPTTEQFGSNLNNVQNFSGSSTVNLRGLGSESTLILVDGKRIGYNGILGGVTDVSSIPLAMVERIELILDGASAVYGSDAVGGVVNIITKKDFERVEVNIGYDWPGTEGFSEYRVGINANHSLGGLNLRGAFQRSTHSGMDASDREVTLFQQSIFPGPQFDIRFCCLADGTSLPIAYRLDGDILTLSEYNGLSAADKERAEVLTHAILPMGFNESSSIDQITQWMEPSWGPQTQEGYSILPESTRDSFLAGVQSDISPVLSVDAQVRVEARNTLNLRGYITLTGESLTGRSPFNPFGRTVHVRGQRRDYEQPFNETDTTTVDFSFNFEGDVTSRIDYKLSIGQTTEESETLRHFDMDRAGLRAGMNSDGVTPITSFLSGETAESCAALGGTFFFGLCRVSRPPPPAVNPFGDLSEFISTTPLTADSMNTQFRLEGLVRGELYQFWGGMIRGLVGVAIDTTGLESSTQFAVGAIEQSPVSNVASFNTEAERSSRAYFAEVNVPIVSDDNAMPWVEGLTATGSFRNDNYDAPEVTYINDQTGNESPQDLMEPGEENTWGLGIVWTPSQSVRVKYNKQTAFVAPQLNQLLLTTETNPNDPFRGIYLQQPDGSLQYQDVLVIEGGNADLLPETADTVSIGFEITPEFLPSLQLNATYSEVDYMNRINRLSNFIVDPNNLPSDTFFDRVEDIYVQERRWINVSSVERSGTDYEILWGTSTDRGDFDVKFKRSIVNNFDYIIDPSDPENDEMVSVVGVTRGSTAVGVVSKKSMNGTFTYGNRGLEVSVDFSNRSKTQTILAGVTSQYSPPTTFDLTIGYSIGPGGLIDLPDVVEGGRISFVVNNLFDRYGKSLTTNANGEVISNTSTSRSPLYGQMYNLSFNLPL